MARLASVLLSALLATASLAAMGAQTLYAVSVRTYSDPGYKGVESNLYVADPGSGSLHLLTSLHAGNTSVSVEGLAIHPATGTFYGITSPTSKVFPRSLVTVDPDTGEVTLVGKLGHTGSDIVFDGDGTLFIWLSDSKQLGTVDIATGLATPRGSPLAQAAAKGGLALVGHGRGVIAATGGAGTLDSVETATGEIKRGPKLDGAPFPDLINGLAYSAEGVLYGINTNFGGTARADLVRINPDTGKVTSIGPLPDDTDALAFGPAIARPRDAMSMFREWRSPVLTVLGVLAVVFIVVGMRSKKSS